ncbi:polyphosphate kinase 1 [Acidithiobacillus concretivorus]|uniref:Polyphosphate kinase n=1 Tax=Acidithiobacillus concretivorus TaxID=3063952 RepID=A0ABS5ZRD8_9PROT|nr:polyphosphate kinase 1 [Acidithiobacillus concretivorus]MBU2739055.1 polyphosphate kinase 1 [Acidithiobacillus concretivorus]
MTENEPSESSENPASLDNADLYFNRDLSILAFNQRVLALADDPRVPLLERLRFLTIVSSNLDEFFEVRMAGLLQRRKFGAGPLGPDMLGPDREIAAVAQMAHEIIQEQYLCLNQRLLPALAKEGIRLLRRKEWRAAQKRWISNYFQTEVMPLLTPLSLDPAHPFPKVQNKGLNFAIVLEGQDAYGRRSPIAIVQAPRILPRIIQIPPHLAGPSDFVFLSSVIHEHVTALFPGLKILGFYQFRVTRNSELFVDEEEVDNLLDALVDELPMRPFGEAVRLEVANNCPREVVDYLLKHFELADDNLYSLAGPVNLSRLAAIIDMVPRQDLLFPPFVPGLPSVCSRPENIFVRLREAPILLHHPYQSFNPVLDFLRQAASDPQVIGIKQTLYRTTPDSPLIDALIEAALAGKQVTAVVELKARFDEANNIRMAERLEEVGVQVVYGVVNHKVHAKMILVLRREEEGIRLYGHLGTGNYHPRNARIYTDLSLLTADSDITADMNDLFMHITGMGKVPQLRRLLQSPFTLFNSVMQAIEAETRRGSEGRILARVNALVEPELIRALYRASQAGVAIDLVVRGACALRPGIPGVSEHIRVRSIVGRFLEHSRVYYFGNGRHPKLWISSADWMGRNLFRRLEVAVPILDPDLRARVLEETLQLYLQDDCNAWLMKADGSYEHLRRNPEDDCQSAQEILLRHYDRSSHHG